MRLTLLGALLACSASFAVLPQSLCRKGSTISVRASLDDGPPDPIIGPQPLPQPKAKVTLSGIEEFRERARLRAQGAPLGVWSKTLDRKDAPVVAEPEGDGYTPPTQEQHAAANALFEKVLRDDLPEGFGDLPDGVWYDCEQSEQSEFCQAEED